MTRQCCPSSSTASTWQLGTAGACGRCLAAFRCFYPLLASPRSMMPLMCFSGAASDTAMGLLGAAGSACCEAEGTGGGGRIRCGVGGEGGGVSCAVHRCLAWVPYLLLACSCVREPQHQMCCVLNIKLRNHIQNVERRTGVAVPGVLCCLASCVAAGATCVCSLVGF